MFNPRVEDVVGRLVNDQRSPQIIGDGLGLGGAFCRVGRNANIGGLALAHQGIQSAYGLLQWRLGIKAMRVEDIHIIQAHFF
ncbi:hypothetical protein D3C74_468210 [compost metagenome]